MANIIQQQDLLKGLPDNRLAMLLQNPVGDIPPFLVAAEAQRRQAIRQQFASNGPQESVVDSLTKQLANVPQNLNAPTQTPPMVPPTPPMQGVMALQQQQQMEQAAQNVQQPQMMRAGGMVQRYQAQGLVRPTVSSVAAAAPSVDDLAGVYVDPFGIPPSDTDTNWSFPTLKDLGIPSPFPNWITPEEAEKLHAEDKKRRMDERAKRMPKVPYGAAAGMSFTGNIPAPKTDSPVAEPLADAEGTQRPDETEEEFRARMEELLAYREPSDWEKSQRWFAMAEQFLDPRKTNMQSVAGAGRAFAEQSAAMAAAEREAEFNREKGLLELDMAAAERDRAEKAAQATAKIDSMKYQGEQALREAEYYRKAADDAKERRKSLQEIIADPMIPEDEKAAARTAITEIEELISSYNSAASDAIRISQGQRYQYGKSYGTYMLPRSWDGGDNLR
jgi:hypothetical protein